MELSSRKKCLTEATSTCSGSRTKTAYCTVCWMSTGCSWSVSCKQKVAYTNAYFAKQLSNTANTGSRSETFLYDKIYEGLSAIVLLLNGGHKNYKQNKLFGCTNETSAAQQKGWTTTQQRLYVTSSQAYPIRQYTRRDGHPIIVKAHQQRRHRQWHHLCKQPHISIRTRLLSRYTSCETHTVVVSDNSLCDHTFAIINTHTS